MGQPTRFNRFEGTDYEERPQLMMRWPRSCLGDRLPQIVPDGYRVRAYRSEDLPAFLRLMEEGEFDPWDDARLRHNQERCIPGGWFIATTDEGDRTAGTAVCLHDYEDRWPERGDVGWLTCSPEHRGRGLGVALMAWVTNRFLDAGYADICLKTEYYRLAAVKTYLKIGYVPVLYSKETTAMWREACVTLRWPFTADACPTS